MSLWVPGDETARQRADVYSSVESDLAHMRYWNAELRQLDPALQLIKARDTVTAPGLRPGYWHVVRDVPPAPPTLLPLVGEFGEYVEPSSRMLEVLKEGDLQNEQAMRDRRARDDAATKARLKAKFHAHEERVGEMVEKVDSLNRAHVSVTTARPWTNSSERRAA